MLIFPMFRFLDAWYHICMQKNWQGISSGLCSSY